MATSKQRRRSMVRRWRQQQADAAARIQATQGLEDMTNTKVLRFTPGSDGFYAITCGADQELWRCSLRTFSRSRIQPRSRLVSLARRKDGLVYAVGGTSSDTLYKVDLVTGACTAVGKLFGGSHLAGRSGAIRNVRGLTFSDQPHELWGVLPHGTVSGQRTDALIRIDTRTAEITRFELLGRCDVMSLACPPRAGGPWHGIQWFMWAARGGLYGIKWANEGNQLVRIGSPEDGGHIRDICFNREGTLYGIGSGLFTINTERGSLTRVLETDFPAYDSLLWEPFVPSEGHQPVKSEKERAARVKTDNRTAGKFNLLEKLGVTIGVTKGTSAPMAAAAGRRASFGRLSRAQRIRKKSQEQQSTPAVVVAESTAAAASAAADSPDSGEWIEALTQDGNVYYYHSITRESSWTRPEPQQTVIPPPPPPTQVLPKEQGAPITAFLQSIGLSQYAADFEREEILDVSLLESLASDRQALDHCLKDLGMTKLGHRMKFSMALRKALS